MPGWLTCWLVFAPTFGTRWGFTPLDEAVRFSHEDCRDFLLEYLGAHPSHEWLLPWTKSSQWRKQRWTDAGHTWLGRINTLLNQHRGNTLFYSLVTSILGQWLLMKLVQWICLNLTCGNGKGSSHSRWNAISTLTEFTCPWRRMLTIRRPMRISAVPHTSQHKHNLWYEW